MEKVVLTLFVLLAGRMAFAQPVEPSCYLRELKAEMCKKWPANRTINLVFHGHSVPSGYSTGGVVCTLDAYPHLTLQVVKADYEYAVVNVITTSVGGENAEQGSKRFTRDVLSKAPDVVFIDYALNDRKMGLERAAAAWEKMVRQAQAKHVRVILMTPTPDTREDILDENSPLARHAEQIRALAAKYETGLVDSYEAFRCIVRDGGDLAEYMAQNNHPNAKGHRVVAGLIEFFFTAASR